MSLPFLEVKPKTQNQRVAGYEVPNEDTPQAYRLVEATSEEDVSNLIWAAYRQIFSEHLILERYRQVALESQLRNRVITVQDFIRALGKSEVYRQLVFETNSNYRLVDITFKRFLGRATYNQEEQIAWSIVIANRGLPGFIDAIVDSPEYIKNFGDDIVPYQRRRFNERPFNLVNPRYGLYWRIREQGLKDGISSPVRTYYPGAVRKEVIREGIPANFLKIAASLLPAERNYQRTIATVTSQVANNPLVDTTRQDTTVPPTVKRTPVALPYRYLPPNN
jgi:phycobilisome rod-core linker protein